jgi:tRNA (guanine-N7-)-methyltransferase
MKQSNPHRRIRSSTHRNSSLSVSREKDYKKNYALYGLNFTETFLDWTLVFGNDRDVIAEIGSGMGEATAEFAAVNSDKNIFAIEIYKPGVDTLLRTIQAKGLRNVRICRYNALDVFERMIPGKSLKGVHIFFPDPWPKRRHRKRRLLQPSTMELIASKLRVNGYIYVVTDWKDYAGDILNCLHGIQGLTNPYNAFSPPMRWRPTTLYEKKGLANDQPVRECFFVCERE